jgi:hypothetical protein
LIQPTLDKGPGVVGTVPAKCGSNHRAVPTGREAWMSHSGRSCRGSCRITCDRCGKDRMLNECDRPTRDLIAQMRHNSRGGRAARAELLTGIDGVSSPPVRRIVGSSSADFAACSGIRLRRLPYLRDSLPTGR